MKKAEKQSAFRRTRRRQEARLSGSEVVHNLLSVSAYPGRRLNDKQGPNVSPSLESATDPEVSPLPLHPYWLRTEVLLKYYHFLINSPQGPTRVT